MLRFILYALLIWFLYNLVFRLIIPVYRTTRQVKKKFREMHEQMQQEQVRTQDVHSQPTPNTPSSAPRSNDYIDFEEVK